jgi:hypothetical protein
MKRILFALLVGLISNLAATNSANAQNSANAEVPESSKNFNAVEKAGAANNTAVSSKVLQAFSKSYKDVTDESWEKTREGFSAKFTAAGIRSVIYYNHKGVWLGSLKGYNEENMPGDIRKIVKREYYDSRITYVQEVQTTESNGMPTYVVHLEDRDGVTLVRVHDGEMEVWKAFKNHLKS